MTNSELIELLDFVPNLKSVNINSQSQLGHDALFVVAELTCSDGDMAVPFVYYAGQDWIFTPYDWQGWLPSTAEDIAETRWRVDDTEVMAVIYDGLPKLAPWASDEPNPKRDTRKRIGRILKETREGKRISIRTLSAICNVNKSQICRVEAGRLNVSIDTVSVMADALGLTLTLE